jgi:hypothetical protein
MTAMTAAVDVAGAQGNSRPTFSGHATVVKGMLAGVPLNLADTGAVDPSGGARENSLVCYPDGPGCQVGVADATNGAVSVRVLHASTVAQGDRSRAKASVAELNLTVAGLPIAAEFIRSVAQATCAAGTAAVEGGSELVDLTINGLPVEISGAPNQTLTVPGPFGNVTIVINEQIGGAGGNTGDLTVNALHVTSPGVAGVVPASDLVVAQAHADITCAGEPDCSFAEKVTSGGFVLTPSGAKASFAAAGGNLSDWGHFLFVNHETGDKLKATRVWTTFTADGFANITGTAQVNGVGSFEFTARLKDNGEPGRNIDDFELTSTHPGANQPPSKIAGGNIQFHKPCRK